MKTGWAQYSHYFFFFGFALPFTLDSFLFHLSTVGLFLQKSVMKRMSMLERAANDETISSLLEMFPDWKRGDMEALFSSCGEEMQSTVRCLFMFISSFPPILQNDNM
jgi:hypothetical protein